MIHLVVYKDMSAYAHRDAGSWVFIRTVYKCSNDIFNSSFDVIVCDGFVGNVALKASEGVAKMLSDMAREEFSRNLLTKLGALFALPGLNAMKRRADPRRYNGASLVGLRGTVVKSHGGADELSFGHAIEVAMVEAEKDVPERIAHLLEQILEQPM